MRKKLLTLLLASVMVVSSFTSVVFAADLVDSVGGTAENPYGGYDTSQNKTTIYDNEDVTDTEYNTTSEVVVYATRASKVTYKIPQVICGNTDSAYYKVGVKGDISATQQISITAPANFTLSDGVRDVTATVSQDKTTWVYSDLLGDDLVDGFSMGTGTISYQLPAGSFSGTFNFTISVTNN
jgi:hypothetical protein